LLPLAGWLEQHVTRARPQAGELDGVQTSRPGQAQVFSPQSRKLHGLLHEPLPAELQADQRRSGHERLPLLKIVARLHPEAAAHPFARVAPIQVECLHGPLEAGCIDQITEQYGGPADSLVASDLDDGAGGRAPGPDVQAL
jgi:hypothetical protein